MSKTRSNSRRLIAEVNMVPFIDVMLVLLIIFMITAPLLTEGVKVNLPKTKATGIIEKDKEPLIVTVDAKGQYYLNLAEKPHQPLAAKILSSLVKQQLALPATRQVMVRGDSDVNYGKIMEAMVILKDAGAKSIGLVTEPKMDSIH